MIGTVNPRAAELVPALAPGSDVDQEGSPLPDLSAALEREVVIQHDGRSLAVEAGRANGRGPGTWVDSASNSRSSGGVPGVPRK